MNKKYQIYQLKKLSILQTGILNGLFALIAVPFFLIMLFVNGTGSSHIASMLPMLLLYPVLGFIGGLIGAFVYNFCARLVGGFEFELESVSKTIR